MVRQAGQSRAGWARRPIAQIKPETSKTWHIWRVCDIGDDTKLNKFRRPQAVALAAIAAAFHADRQFGQQTRRNPVPAGNYRRHGVVYEEVERAKNRTNRRCAAMSSIRSGSSSGCLALPGVWRGETGLVLDGVELSDPIERRFSNVRLGRLPHIEDASAAVGPKGQPR